MKKNRLKFKKIIVVLIIGAGIGTGLFFYFVAARVGCRFILKSDVAYRNQIVKIYYPGEARQLGLELLTASALHEQILKKHGLVFDEKKISEEEKRIEANTKDSGKLVEIENVFRGNHSAYRRVFVLPTLVDRTIYYDFFLKDPAIQGQSKKDAENFIDETKQDGDFLGSADRKSLRAKLLTITPEDGFSWDVLDLKTGEPVPRPAAIVRMENKMRKKGRRLNDAAWAWALSLLKDLKSGDIVPEPVERDSEWQVMRLLKVSGKPGHATFTLQVIAFPKVDYDQWLSKEEEAFPVHIY